MPGLHAHVCGPVMIFTSIPGGGGGGGGGRGGVLTFCQYTKVRLRPIYLLLVVIPTASIRQLDLSTNLVNVPNNSVPYMTSYMGIF